MANNIFSFWNLFKKQTEEEKKIIDEIKQIMIRYPSIRVSERGGIFIDPEDIRKDMKKNGRIK